MDINELQKNLGQNSFKTSFLQGVTKTSQILEFRNWFSKKIVNLKELKCKQIFTIFFTFCKCDFMNLPKKFPQIHKNQKIRESFFLSHSI